MDLKGPLSRLGPIRSNGCRAVDQTLCSGPCTCAPVTPGRPPGMTGCSGTQCLPSTLLTYTERSFALKSGDFHRLQSEWRAQRACLAADDRGARSERSHAGPPPLGQICLWNFSTAWLVLVGWSCSAHSEIVILMDPEEGGGLEQTKTKRKEKKRKSHKHANTT